MQKKKKKARTPYFSKYDPGDADEHDLLEGQDTSSDDSTSEVKCQAKSPGPTAGASGSTTPSRGSKTKKMGGLTDQRREWLKNYQFRIACKTCFWQVPRKYGYNSYRYVQF